MKLKNIMFTLATNEVVSVDGMYIGDFYMADMHRVLTRENNQIVDKLMVGEVYIEISRSADGDFNALNDNSRGTTQFARLTADKDIAMIQFSLEHPVAGMREYTCYPVWNGKGSCNANQTCVISSLGHLYIAVGGDDFRSAAVDPEKINDKAAIKKKFKDYRIK
ncbi:MAG: hypothetical protein LKJ83_03190 [Eubacteriaceae bacterium]|nr:hypothetical protein [Eubacteriaceae bacterium]